MNKPATKEPSMDEILSSIRQIIADDDAGLSPPRAAAPAPMPPPVAPRIPVEPLALTSAQMVPPDPPAPTPADFDSHMSLLEDSAVEEADFEMPTGEPVLVDPDDVGFEGETAQRVVEQAPPPRRAEIPVFTPPPRPAAAAVSRAAPMPDPNLSRDIAEQLLAPATNAAAQGAFAKLGAMSMAGSGQTVESMIRELLRPMLKEWLDENLPSVVERLVEKEIARVSRGGL